MNTLSIPVVAMASISLYVGLYHLSIYIRRRQYREDLTFAFLCLAIVFYDAFCVGLYNATSVIEGAQWQRAQFISMAVFVPTFLWFASDYTRQKPGIFIYACVTFYLIAIIVQLVDRSDLTFLVDQPSIKHIVLPFGLSTNYYEATFGPFTTVQSLLCMIVSAYIPIMAVRYAKGGHKREALPLILATGFMYAAAFNDTMVSNGLYDFIYLMEYAYLGTIVAMAYSLSNTVMEAAIAKDALRKSEERFRALVETTSDWVWEVDSNGRYTYASPKVRELLGYEPEEVIGQMPFDLMPPDDAERVRALFQESVRNRKPLEGVENISRCKDGRTVVLETSGVPFFDEHGKLSGYRGIDRDITVRKGTEQIVQLRLKLMEFAATYPLEKLLQKTLDEIGELTNSPIGFYHFVEADQKTLSLQAWSTRTLDEFCKAEGQGLHYPIDQAGVWTDCVHQRRPVIHNDYQSLPHRKGMPEGHAQVIRELVVPILRDARVVAILGIGNKSQAYTEEDVEIVSYVADLAWEITERKRAEEALRQANLVMESSPAMLFRWKAAAGWPVVLVSQNVTQLGYTAEELLAGSVNFASIVHPDDLVRVSQEVQSYTESGIDRFQQEYRILTKEGQVRWIDDRTVVERDSQGQAIHYQGIVVDITQRKLVEEELRHSRNLLQTVLNTIPARVFWKDRNLRYLGCNQPFAVDAGVHSPEEMISKDDYQMGWREQADLYRSDDRQVMESGKPKLNYEEPQTTPDGRHIWLRTSKVPLRDAGGVVWGILGTYEDITERKKVEEALRDSEEKFRSFVENALTGIFMVNDAYQFIYTNDELCRILGYPREELLGLDFRKVLAEESRTIVADRYIQRQRGEQVPSRYEVKVMQRDGNVRDVEMIVSVVKDASGSPRTMGQLVDITERKRVEEALRESEQKFRRIVEASPIPMWTNTNGIITYINPAALRVLGATAPEQVLGKVAMDFIHPDYHETVKERIAQMKKAEKSVPLLEEKYFRLDGSTFDVEVIATPLTTSEVPVIQVIFQDITKRKQNEAEREALIANLEAKNAELERFTYTVSHDLKAPLITIRGFLGFIEQDVRSGDMNRLKGDIQRIGAATDKLQYLLDDLLELSRVGRLMNPPESVSFGDLVQDALGLVEGRLQERKAEVKVQDNLPAVYGDPQRLVEVVQNLLDNAVKFMGEQTNPVIEIGTAGEEKGMPIFYIRDNGMGIAPEHYDRIFGLFNKLDPTASGTGVGLALVKRIIEFHGGRIWVESEMGNGSTFYFTLGKGETNPGVEAVASDRV